MPPVRTRHRCSVQLSVIKEIAAMAAAYCHGDVVC